MHKLTDNRAAWGLWALLAGGLLGGMGWLLRPSGWAQHRSVRAAPDGASLRAATPRAAKPAGDDSYATDPVEENCLPVYRLLQGSAERGRGADICSVLLRDRAGQRVAVVSCSAGDPWPRSVQISLRGVKGLYRDAEAMAAGAAGRFWVLDLWAARLLVVDAKSWRCRYVRLRRFETENGDYDISGTSALGRNQLFVGYNYGDFVLDARGHMVAELNELEPAPVLYQVAGGRYCRVPSCERDDAEGMRARQLVPAGAAGGFIGGFAGDYFTIMDRDLRQQAAFEFHGSELLSAAPLAGRSWLILGKGKAGLWTTVVNARGGGRPPHALPARPANLSDSTPLSSAVTAARVWISFTPGSKRGGSVLVFRRRDGRFLGARATAGPARVLGARGDLVYLAERAGGRERLIARQELSFRVKRAWAMPPGPWVVAAFAFANLEAV